MEQYRVEVTSENPFTDSVVANHAQALADELDHLANQGSVVIRDASGAEIAGWRFPADDPPEDSAKVGQHSQPDDSGPPASAEGWGPCPSCGNPRPDAVGDTVFRPGSVCPTCRHVSGQLDRRTILVPAELLRLTRAFLDDPRRPPPRTSEMRAAVALLEDYQRLAAVEAVVHGRGRLPKPVTATDAHDSPASEWLEVVATFPDPDPTASLAGTGVVRDTAGRVRVWHPARDVYGWAEFGPVTWDGEG